MVSYTNNEDSFEISDWIKYNNSYRTEIYNNHNEPKGLEIVATEPKKESFIEKLSKSELIIPLTMGLTYMGLEYLNFEYSYNQFKDKMSVSDTHTISQLWTLGSLGAIGLVSYLLTGYQMRQERKRWEEIAGTSLEE